VAVCCQVLEHLPFEKFGAAVAELARVSRSRIVLSLPDVRRFCSIRLSLPRIRFEWQLSFPRWRARPCSAERLRVHGHYWEIGAAGTSFKDVRRRIEQASCRVLEVRRVPDLPWHTFFYLQPISRENGE
jgi:hypothetical protein